MLHAHHDDAAVRVPQPGPGAAEARDWEELVVLVPGLGLDGRAWAAVRHEFSGDSLVVLLPSLGGPAPRGADLGVGRQAERLLAALPSDRRVLLVAHSASCPVVVHAATLSAGVVGLVLVGPVTDPRARTWPRMVAQWLRTAVHEHLWEAGVLAPQYRRTGPFTMVRGMNAMRCFRTDLALEELSLPVQILRGERDRIAPEAWCNTLAEISMSRVRSITGAAHMVPLTHPEAVAAAVRSVRARSCGGVVEGG